MINEKWITLFVYMLMTSIGQCQIDSTLLLTHGYFINPVDHSLKLSGSFGELRSNHFHAGIDIKSKKGTVGDTIRAAAEGFISRIKIMRGSYGKVIYIDHPNGYTTVYAHMQRFSPEIEDYIKQRQREAQSYEVDVYPSKDKLVFHQGQYLGHLGNTGRSYGPHLHFEIRNTITETPQNPYLHGIGPNDTKHPLLFAVTAIGFDNSLISVGKETRYINQTNISGKYGPRHTYKTPAWRAAMAIQAFDQMDGSNNKNGVYQIKMYIDDTLHFHSIIDSISWDETKFINSYIDYSEKKLANRTLIRCYRQKGNLLQTYKTLKNNGFFRVFQNKKRLIRFEAIDFYGNVSSYECDIIRSPVENHKKQVTYTKKIEYDKLQKFKLGDCYFSFPKGATDNTLFLHYNQRWKDSLLEIDIGKPDQPLFKKVKIALPVKHISELMRSKATLVYCSDKTEISFGGNIKGDSIITSVDKLGTYQLVIDTIAPEITPLEYKTNAQGKSNFKFRMKDNYSTRGIAKEVHYAVYIDDIWTISELKAIGDILTIPLTHLTKGKHKIYIIATDHSGNINKWKSRFSI